MSRNPMAGSLKHFRQLVIADKREQAKVDAFWELWDEIDANPNSQQFSYPS